MTDLRATRDETVAGSQPAAEAEPAPEAEPAARARRRQWRLPWRRPSPGAGLYAVATWVAVLGAGFWFVRAVDANPLTARGVVLPLGIGAAGGAVLLTFALRRGSDALAGIVAGAYAGWVGYVLLASYHGTPFGDSGLRGDSARLTAMATRYATTWRPVDAFIPSIPTEYPPLFPWLLGRLSNLLDRPAWSLVGYGEALSLSAAILVAFLLWRRLVPAPVALALAVIPPMVFGQPRKSFEIMVLAATLPWVLGTFAGRSRAQGGLAWWSAGLIGGWFISMYWGFLAFAAPGIVVLAVLAWRAAANRGRYLLYLVGVVATALVVSSWYSVPYLHGLLFRPSERTSDFYISPAIAESPLGLDFLQISPVGFLQLTGLLGLVWYWRTRWWARPMLVIVIGAYAYRWAAVFFFVTTGHTSLLYYTSRLIGTVLASAGVLTVVTAVPALARRLDLRLDRRQVREVPVVACAILVAAAALAAWGVGMPRPPGLADVPRADPTARTNLATYTHAEPKPNGNRTRFRVPAGITVRWFPVIPIERAVQRALGPDARPVTLSPDERLFSYLPWPAYVSVERGAANTFAQWDDRVAELRRLAGITDPAEFARASQTTRFGEIDVFVLRARRHGWMWTDITFSPAQFDRAHWDVTPLTRPGYVVAVRRPG